MTQGLIKDLLDVPDNLERAAASVPEDAVADGSTADAEKLKRMLKGLLEGVRATEKIMLQVGEVQCELCSMKCRATLDRSLDGPLTNLMFGFDLPSEKALRKQGVEQFNPLNEKFNPNEHSALFEVPDGSKEAGIVATVTKVGLWSCPSWVSACHPRVDLLLDCPPP